MFYGLQGLQDSCNMSPQEGPSSPRDGSRWAQMAPRWPQMAPDDPRKAQDGPKMAPRWPQDGPRWPKIAPRWPPDGFQMGPKRPQDGPKMAQDGPKMVQNGSKITQNGPEDSPQMCPGPPKQRLQLEHPNGLGGAREAHTIWLCNAAPAPCYGRSILAKANVRNSARGGPKRSRQSGRLASG